MEPAASAADQLRSQIRRYFLVVFGMIAAAIVFVIALAAVVKVAITEEKTAATVVGIAGFLVMLGVVISSWVAVSKYWRCPACQKNLYWTVSWNMSLFARAASPNCPGCGVELFTASGRKRSFRILLVMILVFMGMGAIGAAFSTKTARKAPTIEAPIPPG